MGLHAVHPLDQVNRQPEQLLTLHDVVRILQVKPSWVYDAVEGNRLPAVKIGRFLRFRLEDIQAFIERHTTAR